MAKINLQPIVRKVNLDRHDANQWHYREEFPVYYQFLYRNKKPVYKLWAVTRGQLAEAVKNFQDGEPDLKVITNAMVMRVTEPERYDSLVEVFD